MKTKSKGFSLVEVLVAAAVLGFAAIVVMQLQQNTTKQTRKILDVSGSVKALLNIQKRIIEEDRFLPAQDGLASPEVWPVISTAAEAASSPPTVDPWALLSNPQASGLYCFDNSGTWMTCPTEKKADKPDAWLRVRYEARYTKVRVQDRSQGLSPTLRRLPMARFYIEVTYPKDPETPEGSKWDSGSTEVLRFTRLVTNAMLY